MSEQRTLNEALRAEKSLYQSLRRVQSQADRSEHKHRSFISVCVDDTVDIRHSFHHSVHLSVYECAVKIVPF